MIYVTLSVNDELYESLTDECQIEVQAWLIEVESILTARINRDLICALEEWHPHVQMELTNEY